MTYRDIKKILIMTFTLGVSLFLAGCTQRESADKQKTKMQTEDTQVVLRWSYGTILVQDMAEMVSKEFEKEYGIKVEWQSAEEGQSRLKAQFAVGEAPDIFSLGSLQLMEEWADYIYPLNDQEWVANVYDNALQSVTGKDGTLYALPVTSDAVGIIYNRELFEAAGIKKIPETLPELEDVCRQLEKEKIQPFGECYQMFGFTAHILCVLFAYEGDNRTVMVEELKNGTKNLSDMKYIDNWFQFMDLTLDKGMGKQSVSYNVDRQIADFGFGRMAMMCHGTYLANAILEANPDIQMGMFAIPLTENPEDCKLMVSTTTYMNVNRDTEHLEEALLFLEWFQSNASRFVTGTGQSASVYKDSADASGSLYAIMRDYEEREAVFDGYGWEEWPKEYAEEALVPLQRYILGEKTREETIEALSNQFRQQ